MNALSMPLNGLPHQAVSELPPAQRWALAGLVVLAHAAAGWAILTQPDTVTLPAGRRPLTVSLISDAPTPPAAPVPPAITPEVPPAPPTPVVRPAQPQTTPVAVAARRPEEATVATPPPVQPTPASPAPAAEAPAAPAPTGPVSMAAAPQTGPATTAPPAPPAPKVLPSSAVRYLVPPTLVYPRVSRELGESGVVRLKVLVDEQGRTKDVTVLQSSGFSRLDQQAVQAMRSARFQPHLEDGVPRAVWVVAPLTFQLEDQ